jgi:hypothetical protein
MSVRRPSGNAGYGSLMMSPPPVGNGLNLQPNWPAFGRSGPQDDYSGVFSPPSSGLNGNFVGTPGFSAGGLGSGMGSAGLAVGGAYASPAPKNGPGHIPIAIPPSMQAKSAMFRELYPHGPLAAGPAGPLPAP